jgi:hypothetical protein
MHVSPSQWMGLGQPNVLFLPVFSPLTDILPPFHNAKSTQAMPSVLFFTFFPLADSSQIKLVAPLALVEMDIRRFHSQGLSIARMVHLLKKHYDTDMYGIG